MKIKCTTSSERQERIDLIKRLCLSDQIDSTFGTSSKEEEMKEQEKIADSLGSINHMTEQICNQIALAQKLKIAISADLLSGRKRVSV